MSDEYKPEVGDVVSVELEVKHVYGDGSFDMKPLSRFGNPISSGHDPKVKFVRRKPPVLESGDVVHTTAGGGGIYLVGSKRTSFTCKYGEIVPGDSVEQLANRISRRPDLYTIVKYKENK